MNMGSSVHPFQKIDAPYLPVLKPEAAMEVTARFILAIGQVADAEPREITRLSPWPVYEVQFRIMPPSRIGNGILGGYMYLSYTGYVMARLLSMGAGLTGNPHIIAKVYPNPKDGTEKDVQQTVFEGDHWTNMNKTGPRDVIRVGVVEMYDRLREELEK